MAAVLAFLVEDGESRVLCCANATVSKDQAAEEILHFVEFWQKPRASCRRIWSSTPG